MSPQGMEEGLGPSPGGLDGHSSVAEGLAEFFPIWGETGETPWRRLQGWGEDSLETEGKMGHGQKIAGRRAGAPTSTAGAALLTPPPSGAEAAGPIVSQPSSEMRVRGGGRLTGPQLSAGVTARLWSVVCGPAVEGTAGWPLRWAPSGCTSAPAGMLGTGFPGSRGRGVTARGLQVLS